MLFAVWASVLTLPGMLRAFCAAVAYSFMEYTFTFFSDGKPFTSFAQFWGNCLYTPVLLEGYSWLISTFGIFFDLGLKEEITVYVLLFPLNIWILELVLDRVFIMVYGRNVAWCYCTYDDSYFGGAVRLGHGIYWIGLGVFCRFAVPMLIQVTEAIL